ncbi:hypothetical protein E2C01_068254 [Portunus trituberculatus]|uniref:Uncharacterized protein n=1 Tax=Portunus trituberculatus TaxID=210409 RepID=A0A5B7HRF8_PORTR|nr:hypothetical protein [Portunus trituberculatus]
MSGSFDVANPMGDIQGGADPSFGSKGCDKSRFLLFLYNTRSSNLPNLSIFKNLFTLFSHPCMYCHIFYSTVPQLSHLLEDKLITLRRVHACQFTAVFLRT